ncbi:unnamed protein product, partial [marine sediment metagenome]
DRGCDVISVPLRNFAEFLYNEFYHRKTAELIDGRK